VDESRLEQADIKIAELQECVRLYNEEIIQMRERANNLEKEVMLDALMQIHNRRAFDLQMREELRRYRHDGQIFSLLLMDVDNFKRINDLYGHSAGDKCLQGIAKLIRSTLRNTDFLARYGGEELVAILKGTGIKAAQLVAEKVRSRIEKARFTYQETVIPLTISIGVTEVIPTDLISDNPLDRADKAMYQSKKDGRNRSCLA
jgi:diguanylate cyclase (GGDEF)-like protein